MITPGGHFPRRTKGRHAIQKTRALMTSIVRRQLAGIGIAKLVVQRSTGKSIEVNDALA